MFEKNYNGIDQQTIRFVNKEIDGHKERAFQERRVSLFFGGNLEKR